jgi:hypothetical protein
MYDGFTDAAEKLLLLNQLLLLHAARQQGVFLLSVVPVK